MDKNSKNNSENKIKDKILSQKKIFDKNKMGFLKKISKFFQSKKKNNLNILETDLIKDRVEVKFNWRKNLIIFSVLLFLSIVIVLEVYLFLVWWERQRVDERHHYLEEEIVNIQNKIDDLEEDYQEAHDFNKRLKTSSQALNNHIYWTNFFSFLEKRTLREHVYYEYFSGDVLANYVLPAVTDDVRAISFQSDSFSTDSMTRSVSVDDEEIGEDDLREKSVFSFGLNLDLNPRIFKK